MGRFFSAIRRWFDFFFLRRSEDVRRSADGQFTGSVEGIRAAYAVDRDRLAKDFRGLQEAVAQVLTVVEDKKIRLERLDTEEKDLQNQLNGAIRAAESAQAAGDTEAYDKAQAAYTRYKGRLTEIDTSQEQLKGEVAGLEKSIQTHMGRLTEFQARPRGVAPGGGRDGRRLRLGEADHRAEQPPDECLRLAARGPDGHGPRAGAADVLAGTDHGEAGRHRREAAGQGVRPAGQGHGGLRLPRGGPQGPKAQRAAAEGVPVPDSPTAESPAGGDSGAPTERPRI